MKEHRLYKSSRVTGRFAIGSADGPTLSSYHPIRLRLGDYWLEGYVLTDTATSYFIPKGVSYRISRVELIEEMIVEER